MNEALVEPLGLPPGPAYAHVFANLYLDEFDRFMESRCLRYFRYVDDFCFACINEEELVQLNEAIVRFFADRSDQPLRLNERKTKREPVVNALPLLEHTARMRYDLRFGAIDAIDAIATSEQVEEAQRNAETLFRSLFIKVEKAEDLNRIVEESAGFIARKLQEFIVSREEAQNIAYGILDLNPPKVSAIRALLASLMELSFSQPDALHRFLDFIGSASDILKITFLQLLPGFVHPPEQVLELLLTQMSKSENYLIRTNVYLTLTAHRRTMDLVQFRALRHNETSEHALADLTSCMTLVQEENETLWVEIVAFLNKYSISVFNTALTILIEMLEDNSIPVDTFELVYSSVQQRPDKDAASAIRTLQLACRYGSHYRLASVWDSVKQSLGIELSSKLMYLIAFRIVRFYVVNKQTTRLFRFSDSLAKLGLSAEALLGFQELAQSSDPELRRLAADQRDQLDQTIVVPGLPDWYTLADVDKGLYCGLTEEPDYKCRYFDDTNRNRVGTLEIISTERITFEASFPTEEAWIQYSKALCRSNVSPIIECGTLSDGRTFSLYEIPNGFLPLSEWQSDTQFRRDEDAVLEIANQLIESLEKTKLATGFQFSNLSPCNVLWNPASKEVLLINIGSALGVPRYSCGISGCHTPFLQKELGTTVSSYFLGLLLLQMLTGACAIKAVYPVTSAASYRRSGNPLVQLITCLSLTPHLRSIIARMLHSKPEYRYPTLTTLLNDVQSVRQFKNQYRELVNKAGEEETLLAKLMLVDYVCFRIRVSCRNPSFVHETPMKRSKEILQRLSKDLAYYDCEGLGFWNTEISWWKSRELMPGFLDWRWLQPEAKHYLCVAHGWLRLTNELKEKFSIQYPSDLLWFLITRALYEESLATIQSILMANRNETNVLDRCAAVIEPLITTDSELAKLKFRLTNEPSSDIIANSLTPDQLREALRIVNVSFSRSYWHFSRDSHSLVSLLSILILFCAEYNLVNEDGETIHKTEAVFDMNRSKALPLDIWIIMKQPALIEERLRHLTLPNESIDTDSWTCWSIAKETLQHLRQTNVCRRGKARLSKYSPLSMPREGRLSVGRLPWGKTESSFSEFDVLYSGDLVTDIGAMVLVDFLPSQDGPKVSSVFGRPRIFKNLARSEKPFTKKLKSLIWRWRRKIGVLLLAVALYVISVPLGINGPEAISKKAPMLAPIAQAIYFFIWLTLLSLGDLAVSSLIQRSSVSSEPQINN